MLSILWWWIRAQKVGREKNKEKDEMDKEVERWLNDLEMKMTDEMQECL